jgi:hypothetical protein
MLNNMPQPAERGLLAAAIWANNIKDWKRTGGTEKEKDDRGKIKRKREEIKAK